MSYKTIINKKSPNFYKLAKSTPKDCIKIVEFLGGGLQNTKHLQYLQIFGANRYLSKIKEQK